MKTGLVIILTAAVLACGTIPNALLAQEVGDTVVVTAPEAELKLPSGSVDKVPRGNHLKVQVVKGNWFWVLWHGKKAWIHRKEVVPLKDGITYFTEALRRNPNATDYNIRGMIWEDQGEIDRALADYSQAIRLDPKYASPYENRGLLRATEKGEFQQAIADFTQAIRIDPKSASGYYNRSNAYAALGDSARAIADYEKAIELDPNYVDALNGLAWLLATGPDENRRDGKRAVELATKACEETAWKDAGSIDTLAAAYAETGDFDSAVKYQQQAIELASDDEKSAYRSRLELYQAGMPYRESEPR